MKKTIALITTIMMILSILISTACADGQEVNVQVLKTIEQENTFPVRVISMKVERETGIRFGDCDILLITIQNELDADITGVTLELIAYNDEFRQIEIGNGYGSITGIKTPQSLSASAQISGKSQKTMAFKCNADSFSGVRSIVSSYSLADGSTVKNEKAEEWYSMAYSDHKMEVVDFDQDQDLPDVAMRPGETVNVSNLKKVEESDCFPVKVTHKSVRKNSGNEIMANDLLTVTVTNESGTTIYNPVIYVVSYDRNLEPSSLGIIKVPFPYVQVLTAKDGNTIAVAPEDETVCVMSCSAESICGMSAIVASYEDAEGNIITNPAAEQWLLLMLESNISELD